MDKNNNKRRFANLFGVFGYLSCSLQWFWSIVLYFGILSSLYKFTVNQNTEDIIVKPSNTTDINSSYLLLIVGIITAVIMLIVTIYVLVKIPSTVVKAEKKIVHSTAKKTAPFIIKIQKKKNTEKNRKKLTAKLILIIKTQLVLLPIIIAVLSKLLSKPLLDFKLVMYVSLIIACFSLVFFALQYLFARLFKISNDNLW